MEFLYSLEWITIYIFLTYISFFFFLFKLVSVQGCLTALCERNKCCCNAFRLSVDTDLKWAKECNWISHFYDVYNEQRVCVCYSYRCEKLEIRYTRFVCNICKPAEKSYFYFILIIIHFVCDVHRQTAYYFVLAVPTLMLLIIPWDTYKNNKSIYQKKIARIIPKATFTIRRRIERVYNHYSTTVHIGVKKHS